MNDALAMVDILCDSQECFNDRPFRDLALPDGELLAQRVISETQQRFRAKLDMLDCAHAPADHVFDRLNLLVMEFASALVSHLENVRCSDEPGLGYIIRHALAEHRHDQGLFLKPDRAEHLLERQPPTNLLSMLKVDTIRELLRTEDVFSVFSLIRMSESATWTTAFIDNYRLLSADDFEHRPITVRLFDPHRYPFIRTMLLSKQTVWEDKMMGTIFGMPAPDDSPVLVLRILTRAHHYSVELLHHSSALLRAARCDAFGLRLSTMLRGVFDCYSFFEPHALAEALYWRKTLAFLNHLEKIPGFEIWSDGTGAGGILRSRIGMNTTISCNLFDAISNVSKSRPFPGNTRMFAMAVKERLFHMACGSDQADEALLQNMDKGHVGRTWSLQERMQR